MRVSELFDIYQGNGLELINMEVDALSDINFVARTSENNGVVAAVKPISKKPFPAGVITVAVGGSVLSSFVQDRPFYTGFHVLVLSPKQEMTLEEKLFYCHAIKMNAYRYSYGRQANRTLKDINLPPLPDWIKNYKIDFSKIDTKVKLQDILLDVSEWKTFKLSDLFDIERGVRLTKENRIAGNIPLATAGEANQGVSDYVSNQDMKKHDNRITIDMFCNAFYRGYEFVCDDNILVLKEKMPLSKYAKLFVVSLINLDKHRYAYGRQYRQKDFVAHKIKLPADKDGNPDWAYMENYIKSLPYSDLI